ncbi:UNVERIFIED_CONTAM: hypothetical protein Sangu_1018300 [Sesamum angustifolium]|uniref:Reverse transcriptase domain-containing protein n=1 Tax=Sesamum angustifolium TaxID=2727405 RepID=A0AAW2NY91_9LAMI
MHPNFQDMVKQSWGAPIQGYEDIIAAVMDFFRGNLMSVSFTTTSIILIPKNDSPESWSKFKPISLCNVTNKILVSPAQTSFVPGMLIAENILLAQEITHHLDMRHSKGNLVLKLDISNDYDRVNWKFLYVIVEKMGFPSRFIDLIKHVIEYYWFTILVNGEPPGFFKSSQGLRRGCQWRTTSLVLALVFSCYLLERRSRNLSPVWCGQHRGLLLWSLR